MADYPKGRFASQAVADWNRVKNATDPAALQGLLNTHPVSEWA